MLMKNKLALAILPAIGLAVVMGVVSRETDKQVRLARPSYHAPNPTPTNPMITTPLVQDLTPVKSEDVVVSADSNETVSAPDPRAPIYYGKDSMKEGIFRVYDTPRAMEEAGIAESDRETVDYMLTNGMWGSWVYKMGNSNFRLFNTPDANLQLAGEDYVDNPVTQLKSAQIYVTQKYGSWQKAQAFWSGNRSI